MTIEEDLRAEVKRLREALKDISCNRVGDPRRGEDWQASYSRLEAIATTALEGAREMRRLEVLDG